MTHTTPSFKGKGLLALLRLVICTGAKPLLKSRG
jgi:hypothetical protein